ncbi:ABC transporter, ATP-binding protein [Alteracholeplasma palmae J233]|uniref:ABC transporter, ATP-binding protein n=1 Tax=Alteracholeplasma palmae (strain ATCC 49389 / J233) TaxID=1318466 RepID=U4KP57_ALTPJ|nr:ABC transporter ATP-binding protein [Alteracholeplasma palmae]CCV63990.1 ABC transporter, ATP-binding protein [Alteracholeplasma palmae J233]
MTKNKETKLKKPSNKGFSKFIKILKPYTLPIVIALLLAVFSTIVVVLSPEFIKKITEILSTSIMTGTKTVDIEEITRIAIMLGIAYLIGALFSYTQGMIMNLVTQKVAFKLRTEISGKINKLPFSYFDNVNYGDVLSRVTNDVDLIAQTLNQNIVPMISAILQIILVVVFMFINSWLLTLAAIFSTLIGFFLMGIIMARSQKYFKEQQKNMGELNGHIEEIYSGHQVVQAFNGQQTAKNKFNKLNTDLKSSAFKSQFISGLMMPIMSFVGNFGYVVVTVLGAWLVFRGDLSLGVISAFMIYIRLFTNPLGQIAQAATNLQQTSAASARVFDFMDEKELEPERENTQIVSNVKGNVEFKNVKFGYDKEKTIINNFSAKIKSGQKVAIVGPTGAGKTTLVNLLMRFYEIDSGEITIDGISIKDMTRKTVHSLFAMVLQDTWIFDGTIRDNIVFNHKNVSYEDLKAVSKAASIHHYIKTLPKGYDTIMDETTSLSSGQRQLITIARAMLLDAPMLILDEATSNVDTRTEIAIQRAMDKLMEKRTSFVIAHRLSTIKNADLILVMNQGDIVESGTHEQLIEQKGFYEELYNSQFEEN